MQKVLLDKYNLPFSVQEVTELKGGSRSKAFRVGMYIVRIPTREDFLIEQKREAQISKLLKKYLKATEQDKVSNVKFNGKCAYHREIKGERLEDIFYNLDNVQKEVIAKDIAELLFAIHSIPLDEVYLLKENYSKICRNENKTTLMDFGYETAKQHILDCSNKQIDLDKFKTDIPTSGLALCHNDLHGENIIINENNRLAGFIDFGEAGINPRISDFFHFYRLAGDFARQVIKEYNYISTYQIDIKAADYQFLSNTGYTLERRKNIPKFRQEVQKVLCRF